VIVEDTIVLDPEKEGTALFLKLGNYLGTGTAVRTSNVAV
jgi:hypothetical protein